MRAIPWTQVSIDDAFWSPRCKANFERTLPHGFAMLRDKGYESNFIRAAARQEGGFQGLVYQDSDVYKLLESVAAGLAAQSNPNIEEEYNHWVELLEAAQMDDGYIDTYFQLNGIDKRWTNLRDWHELYCAGHLIEAGVTSFLALADSRLLEIGKRFADHICRRFGPQGHPGYPGHPELELALIRLFQLTGQQEYFDLARHFVDSRGSHYFAAEHKTEDYKGEYWLDRVPIAELEALEGHAVRALYLMCAVTDIVALTDDAKLETMQRRVWKNLIERRTYITGGVGSSSKNEGFTTDYDLPNDTAYQETCASIAMIFWNHRMALLYGDSKYIDALETSLYNAVLSGISLDGAKFFYENPLSSSGGHHRVGWFDCACCPPNISRLFSTLGTYICAEDDNSLWINLYVGGSVAAGTKGATVSTNYPLDGKVEICPQSGDYSLKLRIPGWCERYTIEVDGAKIDPPKESGYIKIDGLWNGIKKVTAEFQMPVRTIEPDPNVAANQGLVAMARGPLVYCLEGHAEIANAPQPKAIPYALWANRGAEPMAVWIPPSFLQTTESF